MAGDTTAMTPAQQQGWNTFQTQACSACHSAPLFTDHTFRNIGIRPPDEDLGRQAVTDFIGDRGRFKTPTLRNAGLKSTFMHNGRLSSVDEAVRWYLPGNPDLVLDNLDPLVPVPLPPPTIAQVVDFIENALTDPRAASESFPFDRPALFAGAMQELDWAGTTTLSWPALAGAASYTVYRGDLASLPFGYGDCVSVLDPDPTDTQFVDAETPPAGNGFFYLKSLVDAEGDARPIGANSSGQERLPNGVCPI